MPIDTSRNQLTSTVDVNGRVVHRWTKNAQMTATSTTSAPQVLLGSLATERPSAADIAEAVGWYSTNRHHDLNVGLESGTQLTEQQQWMTDVLDAAIATSRALPRLEVYRGLNASIVGLQAGSIIDRKSFSSTTENHRVAQRFAGDGGLILEIDVPAGMRAIDVEGVLEEANASDDDDWDDGDDWGEDERESELLFPRGVRIELIGDPVRQQNDSGDFWYVAKARMLSTRTDNF